MREISTWKIIVTGKVQGVYFRVSTERKAKELGLKGWVRNHVDGSVIIVAQGKEANLKSLLDWVHQGPERADVDQVMWGKAEDEQAFEDFSVVR